MWPCPYGLATAERLQNDTYKFSSKASRYKLQLDNASCVTTSHTLTTAATCSVLVGYTTTSGGTAACTDADVDTPAGPTALSNSWTAAGGSGIRTESATAVRPAAPRAGCASAVKPLDGRHSMLLAVWAEWAARAAWAAQAA
eukprot:365718-Chlamydomonas_euryale.AAC.17